MMHVPKGSRWENWLVEVKDGETTMAEYRYDGLHRRVAKLVPNGSNWTVREFYYNSSWQMLEVRKDTRARVGGAEPTVATTLNKQYVWSTRYIDAPAEAHGSRR